LIRVASRRINRETPRFMIHTVFAAFARRRWKERIGVSHRNLSDFCHGTDLLLARQRHRHERTRLTRLRMRVDFSGVSGNTLDAEIRTPRMVSGRIGRNRVRISANGRRVETYGLFVMVAGSADIQSHQLLFSVEADGESSGFPACHIQRDRLQLIVAVSLGLHAHA